MFKTMDENSTYEVSLRSRSWLKLKKDYLNKIGDSLDLVPIGAFYGTGKRKGSFGSFLLACQNDVGNLVALCRCGSGFSENDLISIFNQYTQEDSSNFFLCLIVHSKSFSWINFDKINTNIYAAYSFLTPPRF